VIDDHNKRFGVLDGWRGISILLVLAAHLLPVGPKAWALNTATGAMGMALFFTLSGFLITNFLCRQPGVLDFLIRRILRIVPLAWLYIIITLPMISATPDEWVANLLFYANWPPMKTTTMTSHFWSLCVEMQFYIGVALLVGLLRQKGLMLLPVLCIAVTSYRAINEIHLAVNTYYRLDEILSGGVLALVYNDRLGQAAKVLFRKLSPVVLIVLLGTACHEASGFLNYFRPYLASLLVGWTLYNEKSRLSVWLNNKTLVYIGAISYALYVIHPFFNHTWLGSGDGWEKYAKRPLYFAAVFVLAHMSTFHFEKHCIAFGKRLSAKYFKKTVVPKNAL